MNPNYVSQGEQTYYPGMSYQPYAMQQFGYPMQGSFPVQPKQQTNAVNIEIIGPTANGQGTNGAMPFYPGMAQLIQPSMPPMPPMPQMMPPMPQMPQIPMPQMSPPQMMPPPPPAIDQPQPNQPAASKTPDSEVLANAINTITSKQEQGQISLDQQAEALKTISGFINNVGTMDPASQKAINEMLLPNDGKTFKGLAAIASSDTSAIQGPDKQKADEVRVMSLLTLANLQKYFRQEFDNQLKQENIKDIPSISLGELPGIKVMQQIVQADPNPEVREAGIFALMGISDPSKPQDIEALKAILQNMAQNDSDGKVKTTAQEALGVVESGSANLAGAEPEKAK